MVPSLSWKVDNFKVVKKFSLHAPLVEVFLSYVRSFAILDQLTHTSFFYKIYCLNYAEMS
jgi:hypothetical protein